jgi:hypothetical protein
MSLISLFPGRSVLAFKTAPDDELDDLLRSTMISRNVPSATNIEQPG